MSDSPSQTPMSLFARISDLRRRMCLTDELNWRDPLKNASILLERREAMELLIDSESYVEGVLLEHSALTTRAFELAAAATRDSTGHSWKREFPDNATATVFYQKLSAFVRYIRLRAKQSLPDKTNGSNLT